MKSQQINDIELRKWCVEHPIASVESFKTLQEQFEWIKTGVYPTRSESDDNAPLRRHVFGGRGSEYKPQSR